MATEVTRNDPPEVPVPDVRQHDHYSCGAASACACGLYRGVGPKTLPEWKKALGTSEADSTPPLNIVTYLRSLGLMIEERQGMSIDDLDGYYQHGWPVIVCVQDYGGDLPDKAKFDYGHYLTVTRVDSDYIQCQDSSADNVTDGSGSVQAPGRILIKRDDFLKIWHDKDAAGNPYIRYGIAVGPKLADVANRSDVPMPMQLFGRTVWVATGLGAHQESEYQPAGAMAGPYQHTHEARLIEPGQYRPDQLVGLHEYEPGIRAQMGQASDSDVPKPICYQFDSTKFSEAQARQWLATHNVADYIFEPDVRNKPKQAEGSTEMTKKLDEAADEGARGDNSPSELRIRSFVLQPETWDEEHGRVYGVIATDAPVFSTDLRTSKQVHEVWRIDGIAPDKHIPLLDNHKRDSVHNIVGSIRDTAPIDEHNYGGWLYVSESEPTIRTKIREGHIKELSAGMQPLETTVVPAGKTASVRCRSGEANYTARKDQSLNVHTGLLLREVSLPVKGADTNTQIRSENTTRKENIRMTSNLRKACERFGMPASHSEDDAQKWHDEQPEGVRGGLTEWAKKEEEEEAGRKRAADEAEAKKKADEDEAKKRSSPTTETIRSEVETVVAEIAAKETLRVESIRKCGEGVVEESVIQQAIDKNLSLADAGKFFVDAIRDGRTRACTPSVQTRSADKDMTADVLGAAMVLRTLSQLPSDDKAARYASDPVQLLGRYNPSPFAINGLGEWRGNRPTDALTDEQKKRNYQLLNQAERFRNLPIPELMRHCIRLDGKSMSGYESREEVIRASLSGGSFGAIFTTNFNALFLAGYLEAADTTLGWVTEGEAPNFMIGELATVGKMGGLTRQGVAPADQLTYGDWNEAIKVDRYSGTFTIDETDLINDRFGMLQSNSPQEMGLAARRLRPNLIYSILLGNYTAGTGRGPTLNQDSVQLFCSTHSNFLTAAKNDLYTTDTGAVGVAGLQTLLPAIQSQRLNGVPLNLQPRFAIISPYLQYGMKTTLFSQQRIISSGSGGTLNPLEAMGMEVRTDARLDDTGSINPLDGNKAVVGLKFHYFLACRPGEEGAKTMHVNYLEGSGRAPQITSYALNGANNSETRWGIKWAVKLDIGAAVVDYRGLAYAESST